MWFEVEQHLRLKVKLVIEELKKNREMKTKYSWYRYQSEYPNGERLGAVIKAKIHTSVETQAENVHWNPMKEIR
jgi:hypothetical protein